jgi:hypothetical protein
MVPICGAKLLKQKIVNAFTNCKTDDKNNSIMHMITQSFDFFRVEIVEQGTSLFSTVTLQEASCIFDMYTKHTNIYI